jgi:RNase E specificity factor CsrD
MTRYPGALLARYHRSDFAILLPHRTLKEAESIAGQLLKAVDALPANKMIDRADMVHIGICVCRSGQSPEQVMDHAEAATRNSVLQAEIAGRSMMTRCRKKVGATYAGER